MLGKVVLLLQVSQGYGLSARHSLNARSSALSFVLYRTISLTSINPPRHKHASSLPSDVRRSRLHVAQNGCETGERNCT